MVSTLSYQFFFYLNSPIFLAVAAPALLKAFDVASLAPDSVLHVLLYLFIVKQEKAQLNLESNKNVGFSHVIETRENLDHFIITRK